MKYWNLSKIMKYCCELSYLLEFLPKNTSWGSTKPKLFLKYFICLKVVPRFVRKLLLSVCLIISKYETTSSFKHPSMLTLYLTNIFKMALCLIHIFLELHLAFLQHINFITEMHIYVRYLYMFSSPDDWVVVWSLMAQNPLRDMQRQMWLSRKLQELLSWWIFIMIPSFMVSFEIFSSFLQFVKNILSLNK